MLCRLSFSVIWRRCASPVGTASSSWTAISFEDLPSARSWSTSRSRRLSTLVAWLQAVHERLSCSRMPNNPKPPQPVRSAAGGERFEELIDRRVEDASRRAGSQLQRLLLNGEDEGGLLFHAPAAARARPAG